MTESSGGCRKLFTFGCVGCLGLVALMVVFSAIVSGIAWYQARNEEVEHRDLTRALAVAVATEEPETTDEAPIDLLEVPPAGTVILDLSQTELRVEPGDPGEPIRVEARFDSKSYALTESYDEGDAQAGWTYQVGFERTSRSAWVTAIKELLGGTRPRVVVHLPLDVPFDLELTVTQGGGEVELGGLWLTNADITFLQGGGELAISQPLRAPAERVRIDFSMGGGEISGLGNASPRQLDIDISMGGGEIDLRGAWSRDAQINISQSMGGAAVRLPRGVEIRGIARRGLAPPGTDEVKRPVLSFDVSSRFGELEFVD